MDGLEKAFHFKEAIPYAGNGIAPGEVSFGLRIAIDRNAVACEIYNDAIVFTAIYSFNKIDDLVTARIDQWIGMNGRSSLVATSSIKKS